MEKQWNIFFPPKSIQKTVEHPNFQKTVEHPYRILKKTVEHPLQTVERPLKQWNTMFIGVFRLFSTRLG